MCKSTLKLTAVLLTIVMAVLLPYGAEAEDNATDGLVNDDVGDYTFFHSDYPITAGINSLYEPSYYNLSANTTSADNYIYYGRQDKENPDRDNSIVMYKGATGAKSDCYIDVSLVKSPMLNSSIKYRYYRIEADISVPETGADILLFRLRDSSVYSTYGGYKTDVQLASVDTSGDLTLLDKTVIKDYVKEKAGNFAHWECYVNILAKTAEIYIDGEHVGVNMRLPAVTKYYDALDMARVSLDNGDGTGELKLKSYSVTGLYNKYGTKDRLTSVFYDDTALKNYMSDLTVVSPCKAEVYQNGTRIALSAKPVVKDGKLYMDGCDAERVFGSSFDETVSVKEFAENFLGLFTVTDSCGIIYIRDREFDESERSAIADDVPLYRRPFSAKYLQNVSFVEELRAAALYERPSAWTVSKAFENSMNVHPRLFTNSGEIAGLKNTSDDVASSLVNYNIRMADYALKAAVPKYKFQDSYRMHNTAQAFMNRMKVLGFAYLITGDTVYSDRAWKDIEAVCAFPDFNTQHVIDTGMFLTGLSIAYDWMYDAFSGNQRNVISEAVINKGLKPLRLAYYGRLQGCAAGTNEASTQTTGIFPKWTSNYNAIANSGAALAALAFTENDTALCYDVLEKSIRSAEYTLKGFEGGGGWSEGITYCGKTLEFLLPMIDGLKTVLGSDFGLTAAPGLNETANFILSMQSQNGINNFHDANDGVNNELNSYLTFLGYEYGNDGVLSLRINELKHGVSFTSVNETLLYARHADKVVSQGIVPNVVVNRGAVESVSARSGYDDKNAFWMSAHAGSVGSYHSHNDAGTFVFDMLGEKWAIDLGTENYNISVSDNQLYRKRTEGHNTVSIDNNPLYFNQVQSSYVPLTKWENSGYEAYFVYDMAEAYPYADEFLRGFFVGKNMSELTVRDEISLNTKSDISWFMHTKAKVTVENDRVILEQNGKTVYMTWNADREVKAEACAAVPPSYLNKSTSQNQNEGVTRISLGAENTDGLNLEVKFSAECEMSFKGEIAGWSVADFEFKAIQNGNEITNDEYGNSPVTIKCSVPEGVSAVLAVVLYRDGKPENFFFDTDSSDGLVCTVNSDDLRRTKIKAMVFGNFDNMTPMKQFCEWKYKDN